MKKLIFLIFVVIFDTISIISHAQTQSDTLRQIVISKDSVYEWYAGNMETGIRELSSINNVILLSLTWNNQKISSIYKQDGDLLDGIYIRYHLNGLPSMQGRYRVQRAKGVEYLESVKDDEWYYWNDKGMLQKKELWRNGRLLKIISFTSVIVKQNLKK